MACAVASGALIGEVRVRCADATSSGLEAGSVDCVLADLPFGRLHERLDVGALLREMARVVRVGGRAMLVGDAGPGGVTSACIKAARRFPRPGVWSTEFERACAAGGNECSALLLRRVA